MNIYEFAEKGVDLLEQFDCCNFDDIKCDKCPFNIPGEYCLYDIMLIRFQGVVNNG